MALSVLKQPDQYSPAYNDLIYVVSSTNKAQTNFNYIASLYIGSDVITLKAAPDPAYGSGVFNFGRIVESYLTKDIDISIYGFQLNQNSNKSYYVKFGEEYGASSGVTQYPNLVTSETRYAWNGIIDFLPFQSYSQNGYLLDTSTRSFNSSGTQYLEQGQNAWQYYAAKDVTYGNTMSILTYSAANVLIGAYSIDNPYQTSGVISHHFVRVGVGTKDLNNSTLSSGSQPVITDSVDHYFIRIGSGATYRYNILSPDCKYITYRLHYLNQLGAFDSFNFTKVTTQDTDIVRSKFKAPTGGLTSASTYGYSKSDRQDKSFFTSLKDGIKLKSDWLSDDQSTQLRELVESPEIYLQDPIHGLIAITCTDSKFTPKNSLNNKMFNLELNIEYTFNRYRQRQ